MPRSGGEGCSARDIAALILHECSPTGNFNHGAHQSRQPGAFSGKLSELAVDMIAALDQTGALADQQNQQERWTRRRSSSAKERAATGMEIEARSMTCGKGPARRIPAAPALLGFEQFLKGGFSHP